MPGAKIPRRPIHGDPCAVTLMAARGVAPARAMTPTRSRASIRLWQQTVECSSPIAITDARGGPTVYEPGSMRVGQGFDRQIGLVGPPAPEGHPIPGRSSHHAATPPKLSAEAVQVGRGGTRGWQNDQRARHLPPERRTTQCGHVHLRLQNETADPRTEASDSTRARACGRVHPK